MFDTVHQYIAKTNIILQKLKCMLRRSCTSCINVLFGSDVWMSTSILSQHMDEGSFRLRPRNKSSVLTDCFSTISYLNIKTHTQILTVHSGHNVCDTWHACIFSYSGCGRGSMRSSKCDPSVTSSSSQMSLLFFFTWGVSPEIDVCNIYFML